MHKIVLAITGASGSIYARRLIEKLLTHKDQWEDLALVVSDNAKQVWETEIAAGPSLDDYPLKQYGKNDFNASFASGSGQYDIMIIAPLLHGHIGQDCRRHQ